MPATAPQYVPWSQAIRQALYGHGGFFHRPEGPAGHFRTSAHTGPVFASAVLALLRAVDAGLDHPDPVALVDVGAGRGELLLAVDAQVRAAAAHPDGDPTGLARRLRPTAVELAAPPPGLPGHVAWLSEPPEETVGLLVANEWLDDVPVDVVQVGPDGPVSVLVEPASGHESPGGPVAVQDAGWIARWWPLDGAAGGDRAEVGRERDRAWAGAVASLRRGVALAVDYGHVRDGRAGGRLAAGTLAGYRDGRRVDPVPDGSCDVTAHVAVDACAQAGRDAGATVTLLTRQRAALRALGVSGGLPDREGATADPAAYAAALVRASQAAEVLDPDGLGGFWWLVQSVGTSIPAPLLALLPDEAADSR